MVRLTDGWYDISIGEHRLFCVVGGDERGVDYNVARLWEDLLEVAPFALEPLPEPLADRVAQGDVWAAWCEQAWDVDDHEDDLHANALGWWWNRNLSSGHLRHAPRVDMWSRGDDLHLRWRSLPPEADGPVWCSPSGDAVVSARAFHEELVRFDRELIVAMQNRVDEVAARGLRADISIVTSRRLPS